MRELSAVGCSVQVGSSTKALRWSTLAVHQGLECQGHSGGAEKDDLAQPPYFIHEELRLRRLRS